MVLESNGEGKVEFLLFGWQRLYRILLSWKKTRSGCI